MIPRQHRLDHEDIVYFLSKCQCGCVGKFHRWLELGIVYPSSCLVQQLFEQLLPCRIFEWMAEAGTNKRNCFANANQFGHRCQIGTILLQYLACYVGCSSHSIKVFAEVSRWIKC